MAETLVALQRRALTLHQRLDAIRTEISARYVNGAGDPHAIALLQRCQQTTMPRLDVANEMEMARTARLAALATRERVVEEVTLAAVAFRDRIDNLSRQLQQDEVLLRQLTQPVAPATTQPVGGGVSQPRPPVTRGAPPPVVRAAPPPAQPIETRAAVPQTAQETIQPPGSVAAPTAPALPQHQPVHSVPMQPQQIASVPAQSQPAPSQPAPSQPAPSQPAPTPSPAASRTPAPKEAPSSRVHPRIALRTAVTFESEDNFFTGFTANISEGGLFIATVELLPVGTEVDLNITLPGDHRLSTTGQVRWLREWNDMTPDIYPGMGVQFTNMPKEVAALLGDFLTLREPIFYDT